MTTKAVRTHQAGERDTRALANKAEVRVVDEGKRQFTAKVLTYNTIDDYGTIWKPGVFDDSLKARMPRVAWAHSWQDPIGHYTEVVANDERQGLILLGQLDEFDAVPRARQAYAQMKSGTIDQFSVGFTRQKWSNVDDDALRSQGAYEEMQKALLDEASPVLVGAVQGTALVGVRSARAAGMVPLEDVVELARRVKAGTLSQEEAEIALALVAGDVPVIGETVADDTVTPPVVTEEAQAEIDDALDDLDEALSGGRSRR